MSYETNPIANRLKITKGWKNSHFPTQTLNYSREMLLWFKVYLFLKAYLSFQQIRLLACEIRISDNNTKILYLSINKDLKEQIKNKKSKWKSKSFLYALKSPLTKVQMRDARFLLYQDFQSLKKNSSWAVNSWQKKIFSKAWISKNRKASWVNFTYVLSNARKKVRSKLKLYTEKKKSLRSLFWKKKSLPFDSRLKNQENLKETFWRNKQRQVFSVSTKIQKEVFFVEKTLKWLHTLQNSQKPLQLKILLADLTTQYENRKKILSKLKQIYSFSYNYNSGFIKKQEISVTKFRTAAISKLRQKQRKLKLKFFWINLKKELIYLKKQTLMFQNKPQFFLVWRKKVWKASRFCVPTNLKLQNTIVSLYFLYGSKIKNHIQQLFPLNKKNFYWTKFMLKSFMLREPRFQNSNLLTNTDINTRLLEKNKFVSKKISNDFSFQLKKKKNTKKRVYYKANFNYLLKTIWKRTWFSLTKTRLFTKKTKLFSWHTLRLIRFRQKTSQKGFKNKKKKKKYRRWKKTSSKKKFKYRLPYRREYRNHLKLFTNWKLQYLIQDFIQKYFGVRLHVKLLWPLAQFKNLKFYRIIFPKKRSSKTKRPSFSTKIYTQNNLLRKRYIFISHVTNHVRLQNIYKHEKKKRFVLKKIKKLLHRPSPKSIKKTTSIKQKNNKLTIKTKKKKR